MVFYHVGFSSFRGGFVGVDIFYVISGYLITSLLAKDLLQDKFSIVSFYERRMRRIFLLFLQSCSFAPPWLSFSSIQARWPRSEGRCVPQRSL